jgi:hypothetical protein
MSSISKTLVLLLVTVFLIPIATFQPVNAQTPTFIGKPVVIESDTLYAIPDENATIILQKGASFGGYHDTSGYYPAHNVTDIGYVPSLWDFQLFSTGNATTGLAISANNCNVTVVSYYLYLTDMGNYFYKADSWFNYSVAGTGTQQLDYSQLHNSNSSNPTVYIDGIAKEQGNGWDWTNFSIKINGSANTVSIHQQDTEYFPPRNAPHYEPTDYLLPISTILVVAALLSILLLKKYKKTITLNK